MPERITGTWDVPGFEADLQIGAYHEDAYVANADLSPAAGTLGTFKHRLSRGRRATDFRCAGHMAARDATMVAMYPATCSVVYLGR
jgi:hypothetical protein